MADIVNDVPRDEKASARILRAHLMRRPDMRKAFVIVLLDELADVANVSEAAARLGISRPTLLKWRKDTPELDAHLVRLRYKRRRRAQHPRDESP